MVYVIVIYKHIVMYINIYNFNNTKVKKYREYERYDTALCSLIRRKSSGSYNRRVG